MSFVLSVIQPPEGEARYGKATVSTPVPERKNLHTIAYWAMRKHSPHMHPDEISRYAGQIANKKTGEVAVEASTGLAFRVDEEEDAPHACPCCERLVLPEDHAHASAEDAYCLGCFTWDRNTEQCLPGNSAHASHSS
ncbi:hypothetical protein [Streptomyces cucumeris]|uniref:hypothetical protein n=1 Tax=Streptomyces cucumeris TaxID=2962890 RepID=UPI0020C84DA3|nr:hypothetical protein [Streptomyces sp. NEAU-Y11]MCP9209570.1 hypothetical protein [Streptomyces sp. NEAU-Y11]